MLGREKEQIQVSILLSIVSQVDKLIHVRKNKRKKKTEKSMLIDSTARDFNNSPH
jgi:hypothetical protein